MASNVLWLNHVKAEALVIETDIQIERNLQPNLEHWKWTIQIMQL